MQLRRVVLPLPLILAAVALASGCVTVRPDRPAEVARTTPAADRTAGPVAVVEALPLGRLPASTERSRPSSAWVRPNALWSPATLIAFV
ncbi:hypothetical protein, partial [Streptomyces sp. NPDC049949]|uniref:hypothetical protein n=1 Tax=Streptomyces sp. NPDC049949 TaxID=3154627 RepID=UPI003437A527